MTAPSSELGLMMAVVVMTGISNAIHPPSNVEMIDPTILHLGEFAESNPEGYSKFRKQEGD